MKTNIEMKQTAYDNQYTRLKIVDTSQGDRAIIVPSPWGYRRVTVRCPYDFMACGLPTTIARVYDLFWAKIDNLKSCVVPTITVR